MLLIPAAIAVAYLLAMRAAIWSAFGVDELVVEHGVLNWSARALWFKQQAEIPIADISQVKAVMGLSRDSHVELTVGNRRYLVGDGLLQDETTDLANALKHAVGVS